MVAVVRFGADNDHVQLSFHDVILWQRFAYHFRIKALILQKVDNVLSGEAPGLAERSMSFGDVMGVVNSESAA